MPIRLDDNIFKMTYWKRNVCRFWTVWSKLAMWCGGEEKISRTYWQQKSALEIFECIYICICILWNMNFILFLLLQILYEKWARPGLIVPRHWKSDKELTTLIQKYYGIPVAVYFCWLRYYTLWLSGPAIVGLVWFLYGLMTTHSDIPT